MRLYKHIVIYGSINVYLILFYCNNMQENLVNFRLRSMTLNLAWTGIYQYFPNNGLQTKFLVEPDFIINDLATLGYCYRGQLTPKYPKIISLL